MMYNLVDNAIRYNQEGGYVRVILAKEKNQVCFSVEDNGIGIPKEEQERIFERFYQVDKSHSQKNRRYRTGAFYCKACRSIAPR